MYHATLYIIEKLEVSPIINKFPNLLFKHCIFFYLFRQNIICNQKQNNAYINNQQEDNMAKKTYKEKRLEMPIENHDTAAWANVNKSKRVSKVNIPDETQIRNAKEYVDSNQK
jgi:hypothetical protein